MNEYPFFPLEENYLKISKMFGQDFLTKSFFDGLSLNDVIEANEILANYVYGSEIANLIKNKNADELIEIRDAINKKNSIKTDDINISQYGIMLVRPETMGCINNYISRLNEIGVKVLYKKNINLQFEQYLILYFDGLMSGLNNPNGFFDFPTRTFNYINNQCCLLVLGTNLPLNIPLSDYLSQYKGTHGVSTPGTFRGDVALKALKPYIIDGYTLKNEANIPLDPIGAYRVIVRNNSEYKGWHGDVEYPILFYAGQAVHIPNSRELQRDMSVLCDDEIIRSLKKK